MKPEDYIKKLITDINLTDIYMYSGFFQGTYKKLISDLFSTSSITAHPPCVTQYPQPFITHLL